MRKNKKLYTMYRRHIYGKKSVTVKVDGYFFSQRLQKDSVNVPSKNMTKDYILKK